MEPRDQKPNDRKSIAGQRYYSNVTGRFFSPDPGGARTANPTNPGSWNRYGYAGGDPVNGNDPRGTCWQMVGLANTASWGDEGWEYQEYRVFSAQCLVPEYTGDYGGEPAGGGGSDGVSNLAGVPGALTEAIKSLKGNCTKVLHRGRRRFRTTQDNLRSLMLGLAEAAIRLWLKSRQTWHPITIIENHNCPAINRTESVG